MLEVRGKPELGRRDGKSYALRARANYIRAGHGRPTKGEFQMETELFYTTIGNTIKVLPSLDGRGESLTVALANAAIAAYQRDTVIEVLGLTLMPEDVFGLLERVSKAVCDGANEDSAAWVAFHEASEAAGIPPVDLEDVDY